MIDTDTQPYRDHTPMAVLSSAECDKKVKYPQACQDCRTIFTPLCVCQLMVRLGCEATAFLKQIGSMLSAKWEMDYGTVMEWVRARFAFLCATLLCVQGSHTKWCALGLVDGASIAIG